MTSGKVTKPVDQPKNWGYSIRGFVDNDLPILTLESINALVHEHHIPWPEHIQFLLYCILNPPNDPSSGSVASPLSLLYRYLDSLPAHLLLPLFPSREGKEWLEWRHGGYEKRTLVRHIRMRMESATERGIWDLIFEQTEEEKLDEEERVHVVEVQNQRDSRRAIILGKRSVRDAVKLPEYKRRERSITQLRREGSARSTRNSDGSGRATRASTRLPTPSEDDDEGEIDRRVSDHGWFILEFMVALWEKDAEENEVNPGVSSGFLSQLWRPNTNLPFDQANEVISIVRQAVYESTGAEGVVRRKLASSLLTLLVNAATSSKSKAQFVPRSLTLALLPLFADDRVSLFLSTLHIPYQPLTHLLTHAIEETAGVRADRELEREKARRRNRGRTAATEDELSHFSPEKGPWSTLPPPTVEYVLELLDLPSTEKRMYALKLALVSTLAREVPSPLWRNVPEKFKPVVQLIQAQRLRDRQLGAQVSIATTATLPLDRGSTPPSLGLSPSLSVQSD